MASLWDTVTTSSSASVVGCCTRARNGKQGREGGGGESEVEASRGTKGLSVYRCLSFLTGAEALLFKSLKRVQISNIARSKILEHLKGLIAARADQPICPPSPQFLLKPSV
jgi:hypothetical protein